eukprot:6176019-Pleurochrysis_carterae.AAC.4
MCYHLCLLFGLSRAQRQPLVVKQPGIHNKVSIVDRAPHKGPIAFLWPSDHALSRAVLACSLCLSHPPLHGRVRVAVWMVGQPVPRRREGEAARAVRVARAVCDNGRQVLGRRVAAVHVPVVHRPSPDMSRPRHQLLCYVP